MSATLKGPVRFRGPGLAWLPAVWRRRATWRTVWRFVWLGPLVGGLPYVWMMVTIPFAYVFGGLPALMAGLLFAAWYHGAGRTPTWPWRAALGALSGLGATAAVALLQLLSARPSWDTVLVIALHGVPAAVVVALLEKPARATAPAA